jgi:hypothetical protein
LSCTNPAQIPGVADEPGLQGTGPQGASATARSLPDEPAPARHGEGLWPQTAQTETAPPMRGGGEGGPRPPEDRGETLHCAIGYVTLADKLAGRERTSFSLQCGKSDRAIAGRNPGGCRLRGVGPVGFAGSSASRGRTSVGFAGSDPVPGFHRSASRGRQIEHTRRCIAICVFTHGSLSAHCLMCTSTHW